jgi:hypothetical protein
MGAVLWIISHSGGRHIAGAFRAPGASLQNGLASSASTFSNRFQVGM